MNRDLSTTIDGRPARIQVKLAAAGTQCAVIGAVTEVDVAVATTSQHGAGHLADERVSGRPGEEAVDTVIAVARSLGLRAR